MAKYKFVIQERMTSGPRNREWRDTSLLNVKTTREAVRFFTKYYTKNPEPPWEARLVRVQEVRTVLALDTSN